jgi:hypothetical protein
MRLDMLAMAHYVLHTRLDAMRLGVIEPSIEELDIIEQVHKRMSDINRFIKVYGEEAVLDPECEFGIQCTAYCIQIMESYRNDCMLAIDQINISPLLKEIAIEDYQRLLPTIEYFNGIANSYLN